MFLRGQYVPETATNEHLMWIVNEAVMKETKRQSILDKPVDVFTPTSCLLIGPDENLPSPWNGKRIVVQYNAKRLVNGIFIG